MKRVILALVVVFFKIALAREDLLEKIRVSKVNDPELNDFLRSVLRHKEDFRWIRNAVDRIRFQQLTRNLNAASAPDEVEEVDDPAYGSYNVADQSGGEENVFFETKDNRRRDLPYQYSNYRRPINDVYPYNQLNEPRYKRSDEYYKNDDDRLLNDENDNSNVKILTRSDAGVRNMPGVKVHRNHRSECLQNHDSHEYIPTKDDAAHNKKDNTSVIGEYYYSTPHDWLGISQDLKCEISKNLNETCVKTKKNLLGPYQSHVKRRDSGNKDDRSIKVNIVDEGKLIKTVEQKENSNSLVLTFKAEADEEKDAIKDFAASPVSAVSSNVNASYKSGSSTDGYISGTSNIIENSNTNSRPLTAFQRLELSNITDDTLDNIDKIIRHDQDSLKNSSYLPAYLKVKKETSNEEELESPPLEIHRKEIRMVKDEELLPENKLMIIRNHPQFNDDMVDDSKYRQPEDYYNNYPDELNENMEQSSSNVNKRNYKYRPIRYEAKQNIPNRMIREMLSKDQPYNEDHQRAFKNRRAHKYRHRDSELMDSRLCHDKRRIRKQHRGRSNPNSQTKILPNGIEEIITQDPPVNKKNLLEDETEPTSAAEQRELEKKDYAKFGSPSMDSRTTEKMLVIPSKKTYRGKPSDIEESYSKYNNLDEYDDYNSNLIDLGDKPEAIDKKFQVKESKDMIHAKSQKSNLYDDEEAINNEQLKYSAVESYASNNNRDKIHRDINSENNDNVNRRVVIGNPFPDDDEENAKESDLTIKHHHGRHILSLPESNDILAPFVADLDYQNGISNAVNIRVKRTEGFGDEEREAYDDEYTDIAEYSKLGPKLRYEKKRVIRPKNVIALDKLVMGAEDTLGLGDSPNCLNKRTDQNAEGIKMGNNYPGQKKIVSSPNAAFKRKTLRKKNDKSKPIKTDRDNDGKFQAKENLKNILVMKFGIHDGNEFRDFTKPARNANNSIRKTCKLKLIDDGTSDHDIDGENYQKEHTKKQNRLHNKVPHWLLNDKENPRHQLMEFGNKKHFKHNHRYHFKNKMPKGNDASNTDTRRDIVTLNKDLPNPAALNEIEQRGMRQNLDLDDSTESLGDKLISPESIGLSIGCNDNKQDNRNELQIIEKDQAIIFKFTTPKMDLDKTSPKYNTELASSAAASEGWDSNTKYCDSGDEFDNTDMDIEEEEELETTEPSQGNHFDPVLSLIRNANGTFASKAIDKAFNQKSKPVYLSEDAEIFDKISNLISKYNKPQNDQDIANDEMLANLPLFIQNRSNFDDDDDDVVNINHHLHKDSKVHPPPNKQFICTKIPKHKDTEEEPDTISQVEYDNDPSEKYVDKKGLFNIPNPSNSLELLKDFDKNNSFSDLDSVESFSDVVEKQNKAKRTKKNVIDDDILPSDFENLIQVEEEIDSGKPSVRKKRYLKFLYKKSNKSTKGKFRRDVNSDYLQDDIIQPEKRRLNDLDTNKNYADYGIVDYDNYKTKYSRAYVNGDKPKVQDMYFIPNMQIMPNNMRFTQSDQNLQSIQNMRNGYDAARRFNLHKYYRNITAGSYVNIANNKSSLANSRSTTISSATVSSHFSSTQKNKGGSKTNTTQVYSKKNDNIKEIMNGQLIMNIIDKFTQKLKSNDLIYKRFGKRIPRKRAELIADKLSAYRDQETKKDIKHAEIMLHQVIIMLNRVVMDQVHRKICMALSPDLQSYLAMITKNTCKGSKMMNQIAEGYPLPELRGGNGTIASNQPPPPDGEQGDFLFESEIGGKDSKYNSSNNNIESSETAAKKIQLIKKLLNKYNNMSVSCQVKVEPVKDYLIEHIDMLQKIKSKEVPQSSASTTEPNDSCADEKPRPLKIYAGNEQPRPENADFKKKNNNRQSTLRKRSDVNAIRSSTLSLHSTSTAPSSEPSAPDSHTSNLIDEGAIKLGVRGAATLYSQINNSKSNLQGDYVEDDAQEVEAAKQKFIKTYGRGQIYPYAEKYSDPITHFQSELSRENTYNGPHYMENNPFNLNADSRPNYLLASAVNPLLENNRVIMTQMDSGAHNQEGNYMQKPEHNSMMLDALQNPLPVVENTQNLQSRKQRRSANSTYWHGSDKYQRLVEAATELRRKRDIEERLGKLFGRRNAMYQKSYEYRPDNVDAAYPDLSKVRFETPLIYRVV